METETEMGKTEGGDRISCGCSELLFFDNTNAIVEEKSRVRKFSTKFSIVTAVQRNSVRANKTSPLSEA